MEDRPDSWHAWLPVVEFVANNSINSSTGFTPFYLQYGAHPHVPEVLHRELKGGVSANEAANNVLKEMTRMMAVVKQHLVEGTTEDEEDRRYKTIGPRH